MAFPARFSSPKTTLTTSTISPTTINNGNVLITSTCAPPSVLLRLPTPLSIAYSTSRTDKWRNRVSFFPSFPSFLKKKGKDRETLKKELIDAITPLDRGAEATPEDQEQVEQIARELEAINSIKEPLKSRLLNGKWELIYTTSRSILKSQWPKLVRPNGKIFQAINADTLRAQNMETWPYFNQVTANLVSLSSTKVAVKFDTFKILGLIPVKAPGSNRGELEITYLDDKLREFPHKWADLLDHFPVLPVSKEPVIQVSRGDKGNLFILKMSDPTYRVPL